ncbi:hypothetical protein ACQZV8_11640 [Magnetococcales bacterium HHB-1]
MNNATTCTDCRFASSPNKRGAQLCHRYPPMVLSRARKKPVSVRPKIRGDDQACGEFQPREWGIVPTG